MKQKRLYLTQQKYLDVGLKQWINLWEWLGINNFRIEYVKEYLFEIVLKRMIKESFNKCMANKELVKKYR